MLERVKEGKLILTVAKDNMEISYEEGEIYEEQFSTMDGLSTSQISQMDTMWRF